jgi:DNA replication protein DnaC
MARKRSEDSNPPLPPIGELAQLAEDLDLTALAEAIPKVLEAAEKEACSFTEFALRLFRVEIAQRRARWRSRMERRSHLGPEVDLDKFDFSIRPGLDARVVRELLNCRFVFERRPLVCVGPPGMGKTRLCLAIGHAACRLDLSVFYGMTAQILEDLAASLVDGTYKKTLRRYTKPDLLIMDEFGYVGFDKAAARHLFRLVSERHENASTMIAANTGFKRWKTFFPSEAECVATVDRLVDKATILRFSGKPFRGPQETHGAPLDGEDK